VVVALPPMLLTTVLVVGVVLVALVALALQLLEEMVGQESHILLVELPHFMEQVEVALLMLQLLLALGEVELVELEHLDLVEEMA